MKKALITLQPLINNLPSYDNSYQSYYNIIGVNNKENYNSNVLAYFFNPEERITWLKNTMDRLSFGMFKR